jgi:hypothetical protein
VFNDNIPYGYITYYNFDLECDDIRNKIIKCVNGNNSSELINDYDKTNITYNRFSKTKLCNEVFKKLSVKDDEKIIFGINSEIKDNTKIFSELKTTNINKTNGLVFSSEYLIVTNFGNIFKFIKNDFLLVNKNNEITNYKNYIITFKN